AGGNLDKGPTVGTGAWLVECTVNVDCLLKKNPEYFLKDADGNKLPYLDAQRLLVMPDVQAQFAAFRAMQLDVRSLVAEERQIVERSLKDVIIEEYKSFGAYMMHFRGDKAPWNNEKVRMATSKALNRQEIVDTMAGGRGWFQMAWANPGPDWFLPEAELKTAWKQDIDGAKKLLAEAGFPNGIDASLWCANYGVQYVPTCELMATQLAKAGIRVKINVHDQPVYLTKVFVRDGQFDDLAYGPQGTYLEPDLWLSAYYHSDGGRNSGYTRDKALDKMIEDQRRELVPEKRKAIILEIQRYLLQKNYQLPVYSDLLTAGSWPWLKNRSYSAGQDYPAARAPEYYWIDQALKKKMGGPD
ncbi:MAG: ABC transporter substrate-binding protein, partial [Chloroflexi bacterium]|nr:ABC transporter substrate-binding protein [Chloroflexota bacterium]